MNAPTPTPLPLNSVLQQPIKVGEPDLSGPLAVFPLFGPPPKIALGLTQAQWLSVGMILVGAAWFISKREAPPGAKQPVPA
jgi:hypothetical protein